MEGIPIQSVELARHARGRRRYAVAIMRRRLRTYLHPVFRKTHPTTEQFVLLSQVRSGSHLIRSLINNHPRVYCDGEIFTATPTLIPSMLLRNAMGARPEPVFGYMLKPHNPECHQRSSTAEWINWMSSKGFKLIHVRREDELRQALSTYVAMERQIWIHRKGIGRTIKPLRIDATRLLKIRRFLESWKEAEAMWLDALPSTSFSYERDLRSVDRHQSTADAIFDFLGVESFPVEAQIERVLPIDARQVVSNWDEVLGAWEGDSVLSTDRTPTLRE